jgi:galactokinase
MSSNRNYTKSVFHEQFGNDGEIPRIFQAPGRINIIGEHVDYLGGIVLPAAIDFQIRASIRPNHRKTYRLYSENFLSSWETEKITKSDKAPWANYILGVVDEFLRRGFQIPGFDLSLGGNIPQGAGLSSSAAVEVVTAFALNEIFHLGLDRTELALVGKAAENNFVGTNCGIMDQFVIAWGKKDHCLSLNTSTLNFSYHRFDLGEYEFSLIQSGVKHSLNDSEYNTRRKECESALNRINEYRRKKLLEPIHHLYDLEDSDLSLFQLPKLEYNRVLHVTSEKKRTASVIENLQKGNLVQVGKLLTECHWSLSKNFDVSCPETDFIVETLEKNSIVGARMIGGGFGGCVLVLDKKGRLDRMKQLLNEPYQNQFHKTLEFYNFSIADGVQEIR